MYTKLQDAGSGAPGPERARTRILILLTAAWFVAVAVIGCSTKQSQPETVRIGGVTQPIAVLVYIADEKGFFKRRGINVVTTDAHETGVPAVNALLAGTVDVATATEFVMVRKSFDNDNLRTFAQIANTHPIGLVARQDHGIEKFSDLKGKKVGVPRGSISEFFLGSYLRHNDIRFSDVKMVDLAPSAMEEAFVSGSVDAVVIWEPFVTRIKERLGENAQIWPVQGRDDDYFLLITTEEFLRRSPAAVEKMLRALIDAESFTEKYPEEVRGIMDAKLRLRPGDAQLVLAKSTLKVRLDQGLLTIMEAEAQWMIRNNLTGKKRMPNYLDMIDLKPLEAVKPEAVSIVH